MWSLIRQWWWVVFSSALIASTSSYLFLAQFGLQPQQNPIVAADWCRGAPAALAKLLQLEVDCLPQEDQQDVNNLANNPLSDPSNSDITVQQLETALKKYINSSFNPTFNPTIYTAGSGIKVVDNVISNAGILELVAGSGITIDGNTISNSDKGSSQSFFRTISTDDESLKADQDNDTLTFKEGSGIDIDLNPDDDSITITSTVSGSSSNGWSLNSGTVTTDNKVLVNDDLTIATNKNLKLSANTPDTGHISRLITLQATSQYDRPWISSLDYTGRHVAAFGIHGVNKVDGDTHNRWELKTSADPNGSNPETMLTRFAVDYDSDLSDVIFSNVDTYGVHNNYGDRVQFVHNMRDSADSASHTIGQWITELGTDDMTVMTLDAKTIGTTQDATIRWFRETNTTGQRRFVIHKGDGTPTESFAINADTGALRVFGDDETAFLGSGNNTTAKINFQSHRTQVGYDGSYAVLQGGPDKGVKLNVGDSSFGQGTALTVLSTKEVGIGTSNPSSLFSVGASSQFQVDGSGNVVSVGSIDTNGNLVFGGTNTDNIYLLPNSGSGRVGVGTSNPSSNFQVAYDGLSAQFGSGANTAGYIDMQSTRTMMGYDGSYAVVQGGNSKGVKINVNNSSFGQGTAVTVQPDGDVGFGVDPTLGPFQLANGAYVTTGGDWTNGSDRNSKTDFESINNDLILEKLASLPITKWSFKTEADLGVRHIGPMAQDFYALFAVGNNNTSISTIDPSGVALAGVQGLYVRVNSLADDLEELQAATAELQQEQPDLFPDEVDTLTLNELLQVMGQLAVQGQAQFEKLVTFVGLVQFQQAPEFSTDTAGLAIIAAGSDQVQVNFDQPYSQVPIVNATRMLVDGESEEAVFGEAVEYAVTDATKEGFKIVLDGPAAKRVTFSWMALLVNDPVTTEGTTPAAVEVETSPTPTPLVSPSPTPTPEPEFEAELSEEPDTQEATSEADLVNTEATSSAKES